MWALVFWTKHPKSDCVLKYEILPSCRLKNIQTSQMFRVEREQGVFYHYENGQPNPRGVQTEVECATTRKRPPEGYPVFEAYVLCISKNNTLLKTAASDFVDTSGKLVQNFSQAWSDVETIDKTQDSGYNEEYQKVTEAEDSDELHLEQIGCSKNEHSNLTTPDSSLSDEHPNSESLLAGDELPWNSICHTPTSTIGLENKPDETGILNVKFHDGPSNFSPNSSISHMAPDLTASNMDGTPIVPTSHGSQQINDRNEISDGDSSNHPDVQEVCLIPEDKVDMIITSLRAIEVRLTEIERVLGIPAARPGFASSSSTRINLSNTLTRPSDKVELVHGSGVFVDVVDITRAVKVASDWAESTRILLNACFSKDVLRKSNAKGGKRRIPGENATIHEPLNPTVVNNIKQFVTDTWGSKMTSPIPDSSFVSVINRTCQSVRDSARQTVSSKQRIGVSNAGTENS